MINFLKKQSSHIALGKERGAELPHNTSTKLINDFLFLFFFGGIINDICLYRYFKTRKSQKNVTILQ